MAAHRTEQYGILKQYSHDDDQYVGANDGAKHHLCPMVLPGDEVGCWLGHWTRGVERLGHRRWRSGAHRMVKNRAGACVGG